MQKAALVGEILADRNGNGVPDVIEVGRAVHRPPPARPLSGRMIGIIAGCWVMTALAALALSTLLTE